MWHFEVDTTARAIECDGAVLLDSTFDYRAQIWGFRDQDAVALGGDGLTLIAEYERPVYADSANTLNALPTERPLGD